MRAEAATDLTDAGVLGLLNSLEAVEATRADVCSLEGFLEAILVSLSQLQWGEEGRNLAHEIPAAKGSDEKFHLTWVRAPVLAHMFLPAESEAEICAYKNVLPTGVGHANSFRRLKGFSGSRALRTGKIFRLLSRRVVYGWFGSPCSPHQRPLVLVAPWAFFFAGRF